MRVLTSEPLADRPGSLKLTALITGRHDRRFDEGLNEFPGEIQYFSSASLITHLRVCLRSQIPDADYFGITEALKIIN